MRWAEVTLLFAAVAIVVLWFVWVSASRLDRLHRKVASSRAVLDNQLVRRASLAAELAASGLLDPVSSVLMGEAAWRALVAGADDPSLLDGHEVDVPLARNQVDRDLAESELSSTVRAALEDPDGLAGLRAGPYGQELVDALGAAWYRVQLARRFHNEAVEQTRRVRRKLLVRVLRLHGHAPLPRSVEIDDELPTALRAHA